MAERFAYVVISHRAPDQVLRLVRVLTSGGTGAAVVCSHDPKGPPLAGRELDRPSVAVVPDRPPAGWGGFSIVERTVEAAAFAVSRFDVDWVTVLSGQDFPLVPLERSESEVVAGGGDVYTRAEPVAYVRPGTPGWRKQNEIARRYLLHHFGIPGTESMGRPDPPAPPGTDSGGGAAQPGDGAHRVGVKDVVVDRLRRFVDLRRGPSGAPHRLGVARLHRSVPGGRRLLKGSYWCTLRAEVVRELADLPRTDAAFVRWFRSTVVPDEAYVQTAVGSDPRWNLVADNFRFVRWTPGHPHPDTLTVDDLPEMLASGRHFARKFDPAVDSDVLDELERIVLA